MDEHTNEEKSLNLLSDTICNDQGRIVFTMNQRNTIQCFCSVLDKAIDMKQNSGVTQLNFSPDNIVLGDNKRCISFLNCDYTLEKNFPKKQVPQENVFLAPECQLWSKDPVTEASATYGLTSLFFWMLSGQNYMLKYGGIYTAPQLSINKRRMTDHLLNRCFYPLIIDKLYDILIQGLDLEQKDRFSTVEIFKKILLE